jgi:hypothetical protein
MATHTAPQNKIRRDELLSGEKFPLRNRSLHLSLEVRDSELLVCVLDKHSDTYIAFCRIPLSAKENNLKDILVDDIFASSFDGVSAVFTPNSAILTPTAFYRKELLTEYLTLPHLAKNKETPCSDYIKSLDSYNLYTVDTGMLSALKDRFPNAACRHHSSIFMEYLLILYKSTGSTGVHTAIFGKYMDVAALQNSALILYNRFYYESANDFLYYLLWVYEQLQFDSRKADCYFYGEATDEIMNSTRRYIHNVKQGAMPAGQAFAPALGQLPVNSCQSLFMQYLAL